jgi:outer membrane protein assembly factor BamB
VAVSPDGSTVFITGDLADGRATTIAYNAATGHQVWRSAYGAGQPNAGAAALAINASPDGSDVYVLARNLTTANQDTFLVIAYDASTGARLWTSEAAGLSTDSDCADAIVSSTDGVYATGRAHPRTQPGVRSMGVSRRCGARRATLTGSVLVAVSGSWVGLG